jgi:hypothetical protein
MTSLVVETDPGAVKIGTPVAVVFDDVSDEIALPYFRPA